MSIKPANKTSKANNKLSKNLFMATPKEIKRICKSGEDIASYLNRLDILDSYTISEASLKTGFSENVIKDALDRGELFLSVPSGSKEGRILKSTLNEWMRKNQISISALNSIKKVS